MSGYTAKVRAYVQTCDGVVAKVGAGDQVPGTALPDEITRLSLAHVIVPTPAPPPLPAPRGPRKPRTTKRVVRDDSDRAPR